MTRVVVIGGGLIGLATAWKLLQRGPGIDLTLVEKEADVCRHQSSHNSGVLHAGLYYAPGSWKARLAVRGIREMTAFCRTHGIAHEICGKVVAAVTAGEIPRLRELARRGEANGLTGLRWLEPPQARKIEPNLACSAALHVPEEGIVDYPGVARVLVSLLQGRGAALTLGSGVHRLTRRRDGWTVATARGEHHADFLINCAGLHSDRIAVLAGERPTTRIVPFRGEYFRLRTGRESLVRHLIYPVPDPSLPFLGVHFTRMIEGGVECGPNAVLALSREGYRWTDISVRDARDALSFPGIWRFIARYPGVSAYEIARSASRHLFTRSLQRLVPAIRREDLVPGGAGVRAQAMDPDGTLVQDFRILTRPDALHVLNAPSPGATACLAIGEELAGQVLAARR